MAEQRVLPGERLAKVEGILEQVGERLNGVETRLNHVESEISQLPQEMNVNSRELRTAMRSQFRWTLGITLGVLIPMWVSIILTILFHIP